MENSKLFNELIQDFLKERKSNLQQIEILDPIATQLRKPVAQRVLNNSLAVLLEIICYVMALVSFAFPFFMFKMTPFYSLPQLILLGEQSGQMSYEQMNMVKSGVIGLIILIGILFLIIARNIMKLRKKNAILNYAGKNLKNVVEVQLGRKIYYDTVHQRYFEELPNHESIIKKDTYRDEQNNDVLL